MYLLCCWRADSIVSLQYGGRGFRPVLILLLVASKACGQNVCKCCVREENLSSGYLSNMSCVLTTGRYKSYKTHNVFFDRVQSAGFFFTNFDVNNHLLFKNGIQVCLSSSADVVQRN